MLSIQNFASNECPTTDVFYIIAEYLVLFYDIITTSEDTGTYRYLDIELKKLDTSQGVLYHLKFIRQRTQREVPVFGCICSFLLNIN